MTPPARPVVTRLCECGCGGWTELAKHTDSRRGVVRGDPLRVVEGHAARLPRRVPRTDCRACGVTLTDENANRRTNRPGRHFIGICRRCAEDQRRERHAPRDRENCDICGAVETVTRAGRVRRPARDHDHATGKQRGILCSRCNTGIGMLGDDPQRIIDAAAYLLNHGTYGQLTPASLAPVVRAWLGVAEPADEELSGQLSLLGEAP